MEGTNMPRADINLKTLPADFESLVRLQPPAAIHDDVAYRNAMDFVNKLTSLPNPTKGQLKYLDTMTILVERYEDETEGVVPAGMDRLAVLRYLMQDRGMSVSDLGLLLGDRSLGPKILSGDRALSKAHIKILSQHFNIGVAALMD
jgi:antitoxin component HigA of HigAB toxin-antitoxin module